MTVEMSSEGESAKSALSEANDKSGSDNHTDTSQDSADANEKPQKETLENNVEKKGEDDKPKAETEESEQEPEQPEKKDAEVKKEEEKKAEDTPKEEPKKEKVEEKENDKAAKGEEKSEESEEKEEEEEEEEEEGSDKDEKDGKKGVPLLDQPLETSGKRERKSVQRLEVTSDAKEPTKIEFENGSGIPLGEIPRVEASITRFKNDDLKHLHRILFKTVGKTTLIKRNIKKFNGFEFKKDSEEYRKKLEIIKKLESKQLKSVCEMLDLTKTGSKDDLSEKILDFLLEPKDSGKPVGGGRPKRASAIRANNRGYSSHDDYSSDEKHSRARRDKGKRPNLKDESSSDEEFRPEGDGSDASEDGARRPRAVGKRKRAAGRPRKRDSSDDEEEDEASVSGVSSEDSDFEEGSRSKRRKSAAKANSGGKAKKAGTGRGRGRPKAAGTPSATAVAATPAKKTPARRGRKPKESSDEEEEEESDRKDGVTSSSEDEPLVKKVKNAEPPTDEEIKTFIKSVLEGANLEEITMKTVCQRVYDHYPDFDLSHKKDFIKITVKSLIST